MLYKIRLPKEQEKLRWVVSIQHQVLAAVCDANTCPADIDVAWLVRVLQDVELRWVTKLATIKDMVSGNGKTFLENLRLIAALPSSVKSSLLADFEHDLHFDRAYHRRCGYYSFRGLHSLKGHSKDIIGAVRGAMECFYAPLFYRSAGYQVTESSGRVRHFDKEDYLEAYQRANLNVKVCPFCDGTDEAPQIDHFMKKSEFPGLSCHPLNLIPICGHCNKGANKGRKEVYDVLQQDPVADWLHPYLRSACDEFEILLQDVNGQIHPSLASTSATTQKRLDNFVRLINLEGRWKKEVRRKFALAQRHIDRLQKRRCRKLSEEELVTELEELMETARDVERGILGYSLLGEVFYREAARQNPAVFDELWAYNQSS